MSTPTDSSHDELRALRERAYGPGADIHADPAALARLNELEEQAALARAARNGHAPDAATGVLPPAAESAAAERETPTRVAPAATAEPIRTDADPAMDAVTPGPQDDGESDPSDPATADPMRVRPWWRRRIPVLWAAVSVGVALLIGIGLTLGIQALETGKVAVLAEEPDAEWPETFPEGTALQFVLEESGVHVYVREPGIVEPTP